MKSDCHHFADVEAYLHGELEKDARADFEGHLTNCAECSAELDLQIGLKAMLDNSFAFNLDERFNYGVLNGLRNKGQLGTAREIRIAFEDIVISLATLLVIVLIAIQLFDKPTISPTDMVGKLSNIEQSSLDQTTLSNDQVLELVMRSK